MTGRLVTEIIAISSLQELNSQIQAEIDSYLSQKEEYSERLGNFLRETEEKYGDEDWFEQLSLDKLGGGKGRQKKNEKKKKKGKKESDDWVPFQGLELSSSIQGEAEVMFEAIAKITERLDELDEAKESIEELRKVGLGNDVRYQGLPCGATHVAATPEPTSSQPPCDAYDAVCGDELVEVLEEEEAEGVEGSQTPGDEDAWYSPEPVGYEAAHEVEGARYPRGDGLEQPVLSSG